MLARFRSARGGGFPWAMGFPWESLDHVYTQTHRSGGLPIVVQFSSAEVDLVCWSQVGHLR